MAAALKAQLERKADSIYVERIGRYLTELHQFIDRFSTFAVLLPGIE
jgi:hypothetical protein